VNLIFADNAWEDYLHWQRTDRKTLERICRLNKEIQRSPFEGSGKPEALKHGLAGYWSRRIDEQHRLVFRVESDSLLIAQMRYHY